MKNPVLSWGIGLLSIFMVLPAPPCHADSNDWQYSGIIPGGHRSAVKALIHADDKILSAGEDGFLETWNIHSLGGEERFQLGPFSIDSMILRPGKPEVCIIENGGLGLYRISAWNYIEKTRIFSIEFRDSISYINYSAQGNFIMAARTDRTGLVFIHSDTGEILSAPDALSGKINFAATGRSERNLIAYLAYGVLSYWDLESDTEMGRFNISANL